MSGKLMTHYHFLPAFTTMDNASCHGSEDASLRHECQYLCHKWLHSTVPVASRACSRLVRGLDLHSPQRRADKS